MPVAKRWHRPLLPFEKHLCGLIGCSEDEWLQFDAAVKAKAGERPADYAHIPDIRCGPVTLFIVNLVVGIALSAVSALLAPKPQKPQEAKQRTLKSLSGRDRFASTFGFDSSQDLANYGEPVPLVFTRQQWNTDRFGFRFQSGGVLISPKLVWSRTRSYGKYQVVDLVMIAGQAPMARSEEAGIFFGNNTLDAAFEEDYQFFYTGNYDDNKASSRILFKHLRYGKLARPPVQGGDTEVFFCPTMSGGAQPGFSHCYTPGSQATFGVYNGIPNGTPYRLNWRVVGHGDSASEETQELNRAERAKLTGWLYGEWKRAWGMKGNGPHGEYPQAQYGRQICVVEHNGYRRPENQAPGYETRRVAKGDTIKIVYNMKKQKDIDKKGDRGKIDFDDVRSALKSELHSYDDMLQLGEKFLIGRAMWEVIGRSPEDPMMGLGKEYAITLKCIEAWSKNNPVVGIVAVNKADQDEIIDGADVPETWFPICKAETANIQNNRRCDVTELGIKSQVWLRFAGLCNFNSVPDPEKLVQWDEDDVQITTGSITQYARRTSFFLLYVRPADAQGVIDRPNEGFEWVGPYPFGVTGSHPVDQFNYIRVQHPERGQYEFRIRPVSSAEMVHIGNGTDPFIELNCGKGLEAELVNHWDTSYGRFVISTRGSYKQVKEVQFNDQMARKPALVNDVVTGGWQPGPVTQLMVQAWTDQSGTACSWNKISNLIQVKCGIDPWASGLPIGYTTTVDWGVQYFIGGVLAVEAIIRNTIRVFYRSGSEAWPNPTVKDRWWQLLDSNIIRAAKHPDPGIAFTKNMQDLAGGAFLLHYKAGASGNPVWVEDGTPRPATRVWEYFTGISEVSHYGDLVTRSCDSQPEHQVVYVNESLDNDPIPQYSNCAMTALRLRSSKAFSDLQQVRLYMQNGLEVERLTHGDFGPTNLFTDVLWYLLTDKDTGAGNVIAPDMVDRAGLAETGRFLDANQLYFDDVIAEPVNIRQWAASVAPSLLCNLTIKNGVFSMSPALPHDSSYLITDTAKTPISAIFSSGNILEDSFKVNWLPAEQRKPFQAVVRYRDESTNKMPEEKTCQVRFRTEYGGQGWPDPQKLPVEEFDYSWITSPQHAIKAAKFALSVRRRVTHSIEFRTLPYGLTLEPGAYIRVFTEVSPFDLSANGVVLKDGTVVYGGEAVADGSYSVWYWSQGDDDMQEGTLTIRSGAATTLLGSIFAVRNASTVKDQTYVVEGINLTEDGIVEVTASHFPVDENGYSLMAKDVMPRSGQFEVICDEDVA